MGGVVFVAVVAVLLLLVVGAVVLWQLTGSPTALWFAALGPLMAVASFADGFGMGCGFTLAMLIISVIRELLGAGTILGVPVFGASYQPMLMMVLPPGAFILIGYLVAATKTWNKRRERAREKAARIAAAKGAER